MYKIKLQISQLKTRPKLAFLGCVLCILFTQPAHATGLIDAFNLSPFVPLVLESLMNVATTLNEILVGHNGTGLLYMLLYAFVIISVVLYLVKIHLPKDWLSFFGFSGGGEMWESSTTSSTIAKNVFVPLLRAAIAGIFLLQISPANITRYVVNPFLEFGSLYTNAVLSTITSPEASADEVPCPETISAAGWLSKRSCEFLVQPVNVISKENNRVIHYGFRFLKSGLRGLMTLIPHSGENFFNVLTGLLLITTFVASNVFMALLIIQAIFDFCISLIMYPFGIVTWVIKKSDKWFDIWPVFSQIIDSLKKLIITMIACAFILCINMAVVRAVFNWSSSTFILAAGGTSTSNVPSGAVGGFGTHSVLWLTSLLTIFILKSIFDMTRERLEMYTKGTSKDLYKNATKDAGTLWGKAKAAPGKISNIVKTVKKIKK